MTRTHRRPDGPTEHRTRIPWPPSPASSPASRAITDWLLHHPGN
jgi:hypothetical protein